MNPERRPRPPLTAGALGRQQKAAILLASGLLVTALYAYLAAAHPGETLLGRAAAAGPQAGLGHLGHGALGHGPGASLPAASAMWMAMMVAMMLPPVLPWIWFFAAATRPTAPGRRLWGRTVVFASGYFALWALYSVSAAGAQTGLAARALLHPTALKVAPAAGGVLLLLAGAIQFSPLKSACLKHCRSPVGYFLTRWRDGPRGAFSMGFRHGLYCLGCCWALMALAFALGTMNLVWMAAVSLLLCVEKIAPGGERWSKVFGVGLLAWGAALLLG
ncbi:MAG: DUF2182 domain-containing protein [Deferrisomatales bacterium]|nr:DUF2182 domain-containing protein [Deferrisomatales bacterium]